MIFFFYNGFILKENILLLFCGIMSSFVISLLFNIYCREIGCYIVDIRAGRSIRPRFFLKNDTSPGRRQVYVAPVEA